jgi:hypothetical protein
VACANAVLKSSMGCIRKYLVGQAQLMQMLESFEMRGVDDVPTNRNILIMCIILTKVVRSQSGHALSPINTAIIASID